MADGVTISVKATGGKAVVNELLEIQNLVNQLNSTEVNVKINASSLQAFSKNGLGKEFDVITAKAGGLGKAFESTSKTTASGAEIASKKIEKLKDDIGNLQTTIERTKKLKDGSISETKETITSVDYEKQAQALAKAQKQWQDYYSEIHNIQEKASKSAQDSAKVFEQSFSRIGEYSGKMDLGNMDLSNAKQYISTLEGISAESVKAKGNFSAFGKTFQTFEANVQNADGTFSKMKVSIDQATGNVYKMDKGMVEASKTSHLLGDSLGNIALKMAAWQVMGALIAKPIAAMREALATMKEVDAELTNIQKVTNASSAEMASLGDQAFEVASSYGVAANEMLEAASVFAKAGYENYADLAELSTKTQLVGDVTAEMASKFLLSADAAYKYEGNITQLSAVLDKANVVENNFATSIEKIAAGFPNVASTAAMANMSIEELIASLGTITAVTQESGEKASYALRALILNILGEVGEVVDEDLTVTQESVNTMTDALKKYGSESIKAAQATGQLIDPMEAIRSLSEAYSEGLLTDIELEEILVKVGGKLRTNQLTALVKNFDMVQEQLKMMGQAAGSADEEVSVMLSSWEAKANILKNTFTKFIADSFNSNVFKGIIDGVTNLIGLIGNLGNALLIVSGIIATFKMTDIISKFKSAGETIKAFFSLIRTEGAAPVLSSLPNVIAGIATTAVTAGILIFNAIKRAREEARQAALEGAKNNLEQVNSLKSLRAEYLEIVNSTASEADKNAQLSEWKAKLISQYGMEADALAKVNTERETGLALLDQESKKSADSAWASIEGEYNRIVDRMGAQGVSRRSLASVYDELQGLRGNDQNYAAARRFSDLFDEESIKKINSALKDTGFQLSAVDKTLVSKGFSSLEEKNEAIAKASNLLKEMVKDDSANKAAQELSKYFEKEYKANEKYIKDNKEIYDTGKQAFAEYVLSREENMEKLARIDSKADYDSFVNGLEKQGYAADVMKTILAELATMYPEYATAAEDAAGASEGFGQAAEGTADEVESVASALDRAKSAIESYRKALEGGEKGDTFKDFQSLYKEAMDKFGKGQFGSTAYQEAIKAILPESKLRELGYDFEEAGKFLNNKFFKAVFESGEEDYGTAFANLLYDQGEALTGLVEKNHDLYTSNGELVASFELVGDELTLDIANAEALAEALNINPEVLVAIMDALGIFSSELQVSQAEALNFAKQVDGAMRETAEGVKQIDLDKLTEGLKKMGKNEVEIQAIIAALKELDGVEFVELPESIMGTGDALDKTKEKAQEVIDKIESLGKEEAEPKIKADDAELKKKAKEAADKIVALNKKIAKPKVSADTSAFKTAMSGVESLIKWLTGKSVTVRLQADTSGFVSKITSAIAWATRQSSSGIYTNGALRRSSNAAGTDSFSGGQTLINELGPEIIRIGDKAYIASGGAPTMVTLPRGAQIFDAMETQQILSGGELYEVSEANAVAGRASGIKRKPTTSVTSTAKKSTSTAKKTSAKSTSTKKTTTSKTSSKSSTTKAKSTSSTAKADTSASTDTAASTDSGTDAHLEALQKRVSLLESELELLTAQNAPLSQRVEKIGQIQAALHDEAAYMRSIGQDQAEINGLSTSWLNYQKQIREETQATMQAERTVLETRISLMGKQGKSAEERVKLLRQEQESLQKEADYLRKIGAEENDIKEKSVEWWEVQERIVQAYRDEYEASRALLESESTLLENQGAALQKRIAKLRETQEIFHREAEYLRSIKADQTEINRLSNEWWSIEKEIAGLLSDLTSELEAALDTELKRAELEKNERLKAIDAELDALEQSRKIEEDKLDLKEKQEAVTEAEIALINAQNERTVRYYNAATGRWEHAADISDVKSAQDSLDDARKNLQDYLDEQAYQAQREEIERRRQEVEDEFNALSDSIEDFKESLQEPARGIVEILKDIEINGTTRLKNAVNNIADILEGLSSYTGDTYGGNAGGGANAHDYANDKTDYSQKMLDATSWAEFEHWRNERNNKIAAQGIDVSAAGFRTNEQLLQEWKAKQYDAGGILRGLGGIKATREDEAILPPDITRAMLSPMRNGAFADRMDELRYLYGIKRGGALSGMSRASSIGTQNNGDIFQLGNVTLTEQQAKNTTVYDFAQIARTLAVRKNLS